MTELKERKLEDDTASTATFQEQFTALQARPYMPARARAICNCRPPGSAVAQSSADTLQNARRCFT